MTWDEIEKMLRAIGASGEAIAYARTRYNEDEHHEYSSAVAHRYREIAYAFDAGRRAA